MRDHFGNALNVDILNTSYILLKKCEKVRIMEMPHYYHCNKCNEMKYKSKILVDMDEKELVCTSCIKEMDFEKQKRIHEDTQRIKRGV